MSYVSKYSMSFPTPNCDVNARILQRNIEDLHNDVALCFDRLIQLTDKIDNMCKDMERCRQTMVDSDKRLTSLISKISADINGYMDHVTASHAEEDEYEEYDEEAIFDPQTTVGKVPASTSKGWGTSTSPEHNINPKVWEGWGTKHMTDSNVVMANIINDDHANFDTRFVSGDRLVGEQVNLWKPCPI